MEALVGVFIGVFALYVGYRRLVYAGDVFNRRKKLARAEQLIREALDSANGPSPWRRVRDTDAKAVALLKAAEADERALVQLGFQVLGDLIAEHASAVVVMRTLAKGPAGAGLTIVVGNPDRVRLGITSYSATERFHTMRSNDPSLARPPFHHVKHLGGDATVAEVVREHDAFANAAALRPFATLDDVLAIMEAARAREQAWRNAQPPDELLEADLRGLLGAQYERAGAYYTRKLRAKLPDATLRRR